MKVGSCGLGSSMLTSSLNVGNLPTGWQV
jgi:hypothetical protein